MREDMIDVKTLRVGNHINVDGKRVIVHSLSPISIIYLSCIVSSVSRNVLARDAEPIPITDSLLMELGFEYRKSSDSWIKAVTDKDSVFMTRYDDGMWQVMACPENCRHKMTFFCNTLHTLENFYYHVFGKELVEG